jgi:hypothetical protein
MLRKLSHKSALLFIAAVAASAFAVPSVASAASWGIIGTTHTLFSANLGFSTHSTFGSSGWICNESQLHADVRNAATLTVTSATFRNCTGIGAYSDCTVTMVPTGFPWSGTAIGAGTNDIRIDGLQVDMKFETRPPAGSSGCPIDGTTPTWTGTLGTGTTGTLWDVGQHEITFSSAAGTTLHGVTTEPQAVTVTGTLRDTTQSLTLSDC